MRKGFEFFVGDDGVELTVGVAADLRGVIIDNQAVLGQGSSATIQQPFRMFSKLVWIFVYPTVLMIP